MLKFNRKMGAMALVAIAAALLFSADCPRAKAQGAPPQPNTPSGAAFLGPWCAQGNPRKNASITTNGVYFTLTNENGNAASGTLVSPNQMSVPQWQFVTGTLSGDGGTINWSNGTFWARCYPGGGGGGWPPPPPRHRIHLTGTWFAMGNRNRQCRIQQRHGDLQLQNEQGQTATGSFTGRHDIVTNWSGTTIRGRISRDGNRIDWDNGTYWIRDVLYTR